MKTKKLKIKLEAIIGILLLIVMSYLTIGYATYTRLLTLSGTSSFKSDGVAWISRFDVDSSSHVVPGSESHSASGLDATFEVEFENVGSDADYHITYIVTIQNDSFYSYDFTQSEVYSDVSASGGNISVNYSVTGISAGETIPSRGSKTFYVTVTVTILEGYSGDINISGDVTNEVEQEDVGSIIAAFSGSTSGDLENNSQAAFTISVANTFEYNRHFNFSINNTNDFSIVDCSTGGAIADKTIEANTTESYQVCIKANNGVEFGNSPETVNVFMDCDETGRSAVGQVNLTVPVTQQETDEDPPVISNVRASRVKNNTGHVKLQWEGTDAHTITGYYIVVNKDGADPETIGPILAEENPSYTYTNMAEDTDYTFIIYGIDNFQRSGASGVSDPSQTSGIAVTTATLNYSWHYSVKFSLTRINVDSGPNKAEEGKTYEAHLSAPTGRQLPSSLDITMEGKSGNLSKCSSDNASTCNGYYYNSSNGTVKVYNVQGDLEISGSSSSTCLAKGTKVLLANGKYKNVEDVRYTDLLAVWDYQNGGITYMYPIWIEQEKEASSYQKTTFSDGSVLKTVGKHAVYDLDKNMFIEVSNRDEFNIGTKIAKIVNGKIIPVTVKKIEIINKNTSYYHVVSTSYYNIIANDILTTDDATILSNLYGFTDNITWSKEREQIINDKSNVYNYEDINNSLPYYMFRGLRAKEAKYIVNMGYLTDEELQYYFIKNQNNPEMVLEPITKKGNRYWPVSIDDKKYGLIKEGSEFTLPKARVKCYFNTSDSKCYKPNDKITIYYGTHFITKK